MPSGKTHIKINQVVFLAIVFITILVNNIPLSKWFLIGFLFGTYYLTPDIDTNGTAPDKSWGMFEFVWDGYSTMFKHRGISHDLILGTLTRLFGLSFVIAVAYTLFQVLIIKSKDITGDLIKLVNFFVVNKVNVFKFSLGIFSADAVHIISDLIYSARKRYISKNKTFRRIKKWDEVHLVSN